MATTVASPSRPMWGPRTANGSACLPRTKASTSVTGNDPRSVEGPMVRLYADQPRTAARILPSMSHWSFVLGAYALVFGTLFAYWWRVEREIRMLELGAEDPPGRTRP
jgi:hypothetical protein